MTSHAPFWMRLDNAAKIYPAARRRNWSSLFRLSVSLNEDIDPVILQSALDVTIKRFPSIAVHLKRGLFWYYLEQVRENPKVRIDESYPCTHMSNKEIRTCAFRVLYYRNRIAVEFFHSLTDGSGGLIFIKSLTAEYLQQKYSASIPYMHGVLDRLQEPTTEELEDSFLKHEGTVISSRKEADAYHVHGTRELHGYLTNITGTMPLDAVKSLAKSHGVSINTFLVSAMIAAILNIQRDDVKHVKRHKSVKVMVPVNLRQYFTSTTLRNFALYINPGVDARMGEYTFEEILKSVHHQMGSELTAKKMNARLTANVRAEKNRFFKFMPLFIKNIGMKMVFNAVGDRKYSIAMSNLGQVLLPDEMHNYVSKLDFLLGSASRNASSCGVLSYDNMLIINMLRNIQEPTIEHAFFTFLKRQGLPIKIESNQR